jgi:hypothetical protein
MKMKRCVCVWVGVGVCMCIYSWHAFFANRDLSPLSLSHTPFLHTHTHTHTNPQEEKLHKDWLDEGEKEKIDWYQVAVHVRNGDIALHLDEDYYTTVSLYTHIHTYTHTHTHRCDNVCMYVCMCVYFSNETVDT